MTKLSEQNEKNYSSWIRKNRSSRLLFTGRYEASGNENIGKILRKIKRIRKDKDPLWRIGFIQRACARVQISSIERMTDGYLN